MKRLKNIAWGILMSCMLVGCTAPHYSVAVDLKDGVWRDTVMLPIDNNDTTTGRTLRLFFRCEADFREDSLQTTIAVTTPDSLRCEEPFMLRFRQEGSPAALQREIVVRYRSHVVFDRKGTYRLEIVPRREVEGIEAIGINIIKSE